MEKISGLMRGGKTTRVNSRKFFISGKDGRIHGVSKGFY